MSLGFDLEEAVREERRRHRRRLLRIIVPTVLAAALVLVVAVLLDVPSRLLDATQGDEPHRLGTAPEVAAGAGEYRLMETQAGSDEPVSYDPCRPIEIVVNPDFAPDGYLQMVRSSMRRITDATGFVFDYQGLTPDRAFELRATEAEGYGVDPVLVGWADAEDIPTLEGDTAGFGGSAFVETRQGHRFYVTGAVVLDAEQYDELVGTATGRRTAQAIMDHEFGHLVGLGHSPDRRELMFRRYHGQPGFGPGDLEGLAALGAVPCASD